MPLLTTNRDPTVITAGCEKPDTASKGVNRRDTITTLMMPTAVNATGAFSVTSRNTVTTRRTVTIQTVMSYLLFEVGCV